MTVLEHQILLYVPVVAPNNYSEVSLLEVLHECIAQNTNTPDIKHLEVQSN